MKIGCVCGATIVDQTDYLPHKGYLIPDQEWFNLFDAIEGQVIDSLVDGRINKEIAYQLVGRLISQAARLMWQCRQCGRVYIDDLQHELQCYVPENDRTEREILRSRTT